MISFKNNRQTQIKSIIIINSYQDSYTFIYIYIAFDVIVVLEK